MYITCAWDFLFMRTRYLIHYLNGNTFKSEWDDICDPKLFNNRVSSLQIQEECGRIHTLSTKLKFKNIFYSLNDYKNRSIFKKIGNDIWIMLKLNVNTGKTEILIIKDKINA